MHSRLLDAGASFHGGTRPFSGIDPRHYPALRLVSGLLWTTLIANQPLGSVKE